jgi:WD40 repeat protein
MNFTQPVQVWEVSNGQVLTSYGDRQAHPYAFAWSPDWTRIALAQFDAIQVFDSSTRSLLATYRGHTDSAGYPDAANYLSWSPDGAHIASVGLGERPVIHIWEAATGNPVTRYHGDEGSRYDYDFEGLSWSPDGTRIVSVSIFSGIQVWEAVSGDLLLRYHGHDSAGGPTAVAWSPDGKQIVSGGEDRTAQVWEATNGKTLLTYDNSVVPAGLAWSPDGKRIASIASKTVRVWQAG